MTASTSITKTDANKAEHLKCSAGANESMSVLLSQGLQSADKQMLDQVFEKFDDSTISATIKQLSVTSIPLLLKELNQRLKTKSDLRSCIKWLRYTLVYNTSYLSSNPDVLEDLCRCYKDFESKVNLLESMLKLQGKVSFLMDQFDRSNKIGEFSSPAHQALAVYEDASSSETESEAESGHPDDATSEKDWADLDWADHRSEQSGDDNEEYLSLKNFSKKSIKSISKNGNSESSSGDEEQADNDNDEPMNDDVDSDMAESEDDAQQEDESMEDDT